MNYSKQRECILANNLHIRHVNFFKQKMKIKLATQLMSRSIAQALIYCKNKLKMQVFRG